MLIHIDGFDHYGADETKLTEGTYDSASAAFSLSTTNPRTGSGCLRRDSSSSDSAIVKDLGSDYETIGTGLSVYLDSMPTYYRSYEVISLSDSTLTKQMGIFIDPDGSISARLGDNLSLISKSDTGVIDALKYNHIEVGVKADTGELVPTGTFCGDISSMEYTGKNLTHAVLTDPYDCFVSSDGLKLIVINSFASVAAYEFDLVTAFDLSTASYTGRSLSLSSQMTQAHSINMTSDGLIAYITESGSTVYPKSPTKTYQYSLSTPFNLSTAIYTGKFFEPSEDSGMWSVNINNDGSRILTCGDEFDKVYQYTLTTPYDISTASYDNVFFDISPFAADSHNMIVSNGGLSFYVLDTFNNTIHQFDMDRAYELDTAQYNGGTFSASDTSTLTHGFHVGNLGNTVYVCDQGAGLGTSTIYQYSMECYKVESNGIIEVRVNGSTEISVVNIKNTFTDNHTYRYLSLHAGSDRGHAVTSDIDDWYIWDTNGPWNNSFIGDRRAYLYKPNQDTSIADLDPSSGDFGYAMIDDASPDDDSTYIIGEAYLLSGSPISGTSEFQIENAINGTALISGINVVTRATKTDDSSADLYTSVISGDMSSVNTTHNLTTSYQYYNDIYEYDPQSVSSFTLDSFNSISVSVTADNLEILGPEIVSPDAAGSPENFFMLDAYPGALFAYSVRQLSSAYSVYAFRVRRDSDNAVQDIGFDFNGDLDEASLTAFVGAANGYLVTWYDQSGNGNDITESTAANQHIIVQSGVIYKEGLVPAIKCVTTATTGMDTGITGIRQKSIFVVTNFGNPGGDGDPSRIITSYSGAAAVNNELIVDRLESTSTVRYFDGGGSVTVGSVSASLHQITAIRTTTARTIQIDGGSVATNAVGTAVQANTYKIFEEGGSSTNEFVESMSELIFYNSDQTANRNNINNAQKSYFGTP